MIMVKKSSLFLNIWDIMSESLQPELINLCETILYPTQLPALMCRRGYCALLILEATLYTIWDLGPW